MNEYELSEHLLAKDFNESVLLFQWDMGGTSNSLNTINVIIWHENIHLGL